MNNNFICSRCNKHLSSKKRFENHKNRKTKCKQKKLKLNIKPSKILLLLKHLLDVVVVILDLKNLDLILFL